MQPLSSSIESYSEAAARLFASYCSRNGEPPCVVAVSAQFYNSWAEELGVDPIYVCDVPVEILDVLGADQAVAIPSGAALRSDDGRVSLEDVDCFVVTRGRGFSLLCWTGTHA